MFSNPATQRHRVLECHLFEAGTYNDLAVRPYTTNITGNTINMLDDVTRGGQNFDTSVLSQVSGDILRPSAVAAGIAPIVGGWNESRFMFIMAIEEMGVNNVSTVHYFTGYTNHLGISHSGHLDESMMLYFNGCISVTRTMIQTPTGNQWHNSVNNAFEYMPRSASINDGQERLMRPMDVFNVMALGLHLNDYSMFGNDVNIHNASSSMITHSKVNSVNNNLTGRYLGNILKSHNAACDESESFEDSPEDIYHRSAGTAAAIGDVSIQQTPLWNQLTKSSNFESDCGIPLQSLARIFPELKDPSVIRANRASAAARGGMSMAGNTEYWTGSTHETIAASVVSTALPALMMGCLITEFQFEITNLTLDGQPQSQILSANSAVAGIEIDAHAQRLMQRIQLELFNDITNCGQLRVHLQVNCSLAGDLIINISVNGGVITPYVMPAFCSALANRVMAPTQQIVDNVASDLQTVTDTMRELTINNTQQQGFGLHENQSTI